MLAKGDLTSIRKVIREEVEAESENLQGEIKMSQLRIMSRIGRVEDRLKNIEIKTSKIQKDVKTAVNFLDKEGLKRLKELKELRNTSTYRQWINNLYK